MIFVFGSNTAGIHGAGAAKHAMLYEGAILRQGYGMAGNSFAIPTKDHKILTLPLDKIQMYVTEFKKFAQAVHIPGSDKQSHEFKVTRIGCGLAGYHDSDIAPMFLGSPDNCYFDTEWRQYLGSGYNYWGTV